MTGEIQKYQQLVDRLHERTLSGSINWEMEWNSDISCQLGRYVVKLDSFKDENGEPFETVELVDEQGRSIDAFNDARLAQLTPQDDIHATYYLKMKDLRERARRQALGADKALDQILEELEDDIPF